MAMTLLQIVLNKPGGMVHNIMFNRILLILENLAKTTTLLSEVILCKTKDTEEDHSKIDTV